MVKAVEVVHLFEAKGVVEVQNLLKEVGVLDELRQVVREEHEMLVLKVFSGVKVVVVCSLEQQSESMNLKYLVLEVVVEQIL